MVLERESSEHEQDMNLLMPTTYLWCNFLQFHPTNLLNAPNWGAEAGKFMKFRPSGILRVILPRDSFRISLPVARTQSIYLIFAFVRQFRPACDSTATNNLGTNGQLISFVYNNVNWMPEFLILHRIRFLKYLNYGHFRMAQQMHNRREWWKIHFVYQYIFEIYAPYKLAFIYRPHRTHILFQADFTLRSEENWLRKNFYPNDSRMMTSRTGVPTRSRLLIRIPEKSNFSDPVLIRLSEPVWTKKIPVPNFTLTKERIRTPFRPKKGIQKIKEPNIRANTMANMK